MINANDSLMNEYMLKRKCQMLLPKKYEITVYKLSAKYSRCSSWTLTGALLAVSRGSISSITIESI